MDFPRRLEFLFRDVIMEAFDDELDTLLARPITVERVDQWIAIVGDSGMGYWKKMIARRILGRKRKQAEKGKRVVFSAHERSLLREKASEYLPRLLVRKWLAALLVHAEKNGGVLRLSSFDDAMIPFGMSAMDLDPRFVVFGVTDAHIRRMLLLVRRELGNEPLPEEARAWLEAHGVHFEA